MKINKKSNLISFSLWVTIALVNWASGTEPMHPTILELRQSFEQSGGKVTILEIEAKARQFREVIGTTNFSPSSDVEKVIRDAGAVAVALFNYKSAKNMNISDTNEPTLLAIDSLLEKVNAAIVKDWKDLPVLLNVSPPSGTPRGAAGMNPNAIADPKIKQEYLDRIAENQNNNLKNRQQKELRDVRRKILLIAYGLSVSNDSNERWGRPQVYARFAKDEESKVLLDQAFGSSRK